MFAIVTESAERRHREIEVEASDASSTIATINHGVPVSQPVVSSRYESIAVGNPRNTNHADWLDGPVDVMFVRKLCDRKQGVDVDWAVVLIIKRG